MTSPFDARYFRRYYESRGSRVYGAHHVAHLAQGVAGFVGGFGGEIEVVLDVGAGIGLWKKLVCETPTGRELRLHRRERLRMLEVRPREA